MAHLLPTSTVHGKTGADNDESNVTTDVEDHPPAPPTSLNHTNPTLFHKIQTQRSILALLVSDSKLYAGTQTGDLLVCYSNDPRHIVKAANKSKVWSLETYELLSTVNAHRGSVLCLCLSTDKTLLFSSAGDAIVNVRRPIDQPSRILLTGPGLVHKDPQSTLLDLLHIRRRGCLLRRVLARSADCLSRGSEHKHTSDVPTYTADYSDPHQANPS